MNKRKLNYRFRNPNSAEDTADFLCKLLIEANAGKVERTIEKAAARCAEDCEYIAEPEDDYFGAKAPELSLPQL